MKRALLGCWVLASACVTAWASDAVRSSTNYTVSSEAMTSGALGFSDGMLRVDCSTDVPVTQRVYGDTGVSAIAGHVGQLYDLLFLFIEASPQDNWPENASVQLSPIAWTDDDTRLRARVGETEWTLNYGPITAVDASDRAHTASVYQPTPASISGLFSGLAAVLYVTVANTDPDNYGLYARDGISDNWQIYNFGIDAPAGTPDADPDRDLRTNREEYLTGFDPLDPTQKFVFTIRGVTGSTAFLEMNRVIAGRTYTVWASTDFSAWRSVGSLSPSSPLINPTVQDPGATEPAGFYLVDIQLRP